MFSWPGRISLTGLCMFGFRWTGYTWSQHDNRVVRDAAAQQPCYLTVFFASLRRIISLWMNTSYRDSYQARNNLTRPSSISTLARQSSTPSDRPVSADECLMSPARTFSYPGSNFLLSIWHIDLSNSLSVTTCPVAILITLPAALSTLEAFIFAVRHANVCTVSGKDNSAMQW